jgi:TRAP transporter 4TM/12TM fusion protein
MFTRNGLAWLLGLAMSLFHLYTAGIGLLQQPVQRAIHVGFTLALIFLLYPCKRKALRWTDWLWLAASVAGTGYVAAFYNDIAMRGGVIITRELILGGVTIAVVLEAARRALGKALPILALVFLLYCHFGSYAPGFLEIRGYSLTRIIQHMYLTNEGVFGVAAGVSSTYIFMFILFGAFLSAGGGAQLFNNLALALAGKFSGGPAKVAVVGSCLLGTINGSSIANVVTVGTLTIPMMKKVGYSAEEAAGIEATASTGGQFLPPIMGAGAFIMAEFLNLPYLTIAKAALLPALLYYTAVFAHVHYIAKRDNIGGIESDVSAWRVMKKDGYLLLPIFVIVALLLMRYTPLKAAFWAIIAIYCLSLLVGKRAMTPRILLETLSGGARGAVKTAVACAVVGFIVGTCSLTALGLNFSNNLLSLTNGSLLPTLLLAMLACLILGMGLPTTANYIVTSTIIAPALMKMGVPGLAAHLFVFYFGIKADITPPVCLATFAASGIANANPARAGITAFCIAFPSFFLPYMFVYSPAILLSGSVQATLVTTALALGGICGITGFATGWFGRAIGPLVRFLALAGGIFCFLPQTEFRAAGLAIVVLLAGYSFFSTRLKSGTANP